jgi:hypothetical protein
MHADRDSSARVRGIWRSDIRAFEPYLLPVRCQVDSEGRKGSVGVADVSFCKHSVNEGEEY